MDLNIIFFVRLVLAVLLGGFVGWQRERTHHAAGIRTHALVALGSAVFTILSQTGFLGADPARVAAQIVVGIGFLGAGIIFQRGASVVGLTTAAGVWVAASIGMAVGTGYYLMAVATSFLTFVLLLINDNWFAPGAHRKTE